MKIYKSKIGVGLVLFIVLVLGGTSIVMIYQKAWSGFFINILLGGFIVHLFQNTYYTIKGNVLIVKSGFIINRSIDIHSITKISKTNNLISAPAVSLDRLLVNFGKANCVIISPKDKLGFIDHLKTINPKIELNTSN